MYPEIEAKFKQLELWLLMQLASQYIAGKPCVLKRRDPASIGAVGLTTVNMQGVPIVTLMPSLQDEGDQVLLETYLHELAHVRLHSGMIRRTNTDMQPPNSKETPPSPREYENEANDQAKAWLEYGERHRDLNEPYAQGVIYALVDYYTKGKTE